MNHLLYPTRIKAYLETTCLPPLQCGMSMPSIFGGDAGCAASFSKTTGGGRHANHA